MVEDLPFMSGNSCPETSRPQWSGETAVPSDLECRRAGPDPSVDDSSRGRGRSVGRGRGHAGHASITTQTALPPLGTGQRAPGPGEALTTCIPRPRALHRAGADQARRVVVAVMDGEAQPGPDRRQRDIDRRTRVGDAVRDQLAHHEHGGRDAVLEPPVQAGAAHEVPGGAARAWVGSQVDPRPCASRGRRTARTRRPASEPPTTTSPPAGRSGRRGVRPSPVTSASRVPGQCSR